MMTALVALRRGNLADTVVVQLGDLAVWSTIGLTAGEQWSLGDLLYALMLPSDNAVALTIARHIAGSEAAFVDLMNAQAAEWGLKDTRFANPHGLDQAQHYSTAHDLAQIAARGLAQPVFAEIISTREHRVGGRTLRNTNELLGVYAGAAGVKTGTTELAGQCLVSVVRRPDGRALSVIMGSVDRYRDSRLLLDYYFANYVIVPLELGVKGVNLVSKPDGTIGVLALREPGRVLLPRWRVPWLRVQRFYDLSTLAQGEGPVGMVRFIAGGDNLAELPLYLLAP
jgi:D-alanyl-D-alanine carboxypeptidase (penicillin-binding protein 5/6)